MDQPTTTIAGVKLATLLFAFLGSCVSLSYANEMTRVQMVTAVVSGVAVAVSAAPLVLHYLVLDDTLERAVSFFLGLVAMRAIPVLFSWVDRMRDFKFPSLPDRKE
jgi:hypothetical protein